MYTGRIGAREEVHFPVKKKNRIRSQQLIDIKLCEQKYNFNRRKHEFRYQQFDFTK